jgi:transcriptional regulator with XRE-family HTH domain
MHSGPEQLKDWMSRKGFKQADACRFLGFDAATMSNFLAGKRTPGLETAVRIERSTGIPVEAWLPTEIDEAADESASRHAKAAR